MCCLVLPDVCTGLGFPRKLSKVFVHKQWRNVFLVSESVAVVPLHQSGKCGLGCGVGAVPWNTNDTAEVCVKCVGRGRNLLRKGTNMGQWGECTYGTNNHSE